MDQFSFKEIEDLPVLGRFRKALHVLTGLPFDFVDTRGRSSSQLKPLEAYTPFCRLISQSVSGRIACKKCDLGAIKRCVETKKPLAYVCHLGLTDIAVPLVIRGEVVGVLCSGQFLSFQPAEKEFQKITNRLIKLGVNLSKAEKCYGAIPAVKKERAETIIDLIAIVTEYIIEAERKIFNLTDVLHKDKIRQAQEFIFRHYKEKISLKETADAVHLSPFRLAHLFQEKRRTSFTRYLNSLRIEESKLLLSGTNLKVVEVAVRSGFSSLSYFNRFFRNEAGLSPREYRKQQTSIRI
ncbi:MAG: PocR ligand-binding domain-containing protein [Candidatus Omnitrophica bacterium]|nr:PocR ligand-binding domain-containing protein [Candidatus Omnitrophota bacterium]